ncbi:hypothetical protein N7520_004950 [Penicillium odoratum]|uniref:uncharacterized protein n=1 Tax=Penicillium odoratum TaxID=1167516 RepID=UPI0025478944|nr:uncharacterized protein N7520_004950 [Penicillium odoratum]KAJ5765391.1 hypothetical protein N7520_004950 [Penicillium odoratum]
MHFPAFPAVGASQQWQLSVDNLKRLNSGITCPNLDTSKLYCASNTTETAPTNSPTMPGTAANCDSFHLVLSGDQCDTIAAKYGISEAQFKSRNSKVNDQCRNLWLDYYVCVHVPGATKNSAPKPTADPTGPTP